MEPVPVYPASLVDELVGALEYLEVSIGRVNYDGEIGDVEDLDEARRVAAERLANFHRATGGDDD